MELMICDRCRIRDYRTSAGRFTNLFAVLLTLLAIATTVSGLALPYEVSQSNENSVKSREISLPNQISRRCQPVPHDVLWLRLNLAPNYPPSTVSAPASGPQNDHPQPPIIDLNDIVAQEPEVISSTRQDGGRRHRREAKRDRRQRRRNEQKAHRRRHARKNSRRRANLLAQLSDGEAWQCHMTTRWQRMPSDVFPPYVQTGSCAQSRCMLGLYECRARKYATRILRRVSGRCNPLPLVGDAAASGYEEAWVAEEYHVTVGCECSKRRVSGYYDEHSPGV